MAQNSKTVTNKRGLLSRLFDNNWFVLAFSVIIAVVLWCGVSMFQTTEVEKQFPNIKVQLNYDGSLPANKNMQIFGEQEFYVDVTVKGKSYLVNDENFASKVNASVSFASVTASGTYALPIIVSVEDNQAEVVNYSKSTVSVYVDELIEKNFPLTDEVNELNGYALPEGYNRENPRLSVESVTLEGPALELSRVAAVKAVVDLNKELTATETFTAELVFTGVTETSSFPNVTLKDAEPVFVTIPITRTAEYKPVVTFTNMPKAYRESGVEYTISPETVTLTVATGENQEPVSDEISVGTIDFSEINNDRNYFRLTPDDGQYEFTDGTKQFTVSIDMSSMHKRWLEIAVSTEDITLPKNATVLTEKIASVQIIGPADSVDGIENSEAYAVPLLENVTLEKGLNEVPVKIVLRTLTDSWVRGEYTVQIQVD